MRDPGPRCPFEKDRNGTEETIADSSAGTTDDSCMASNAPSEDTNKNAPFCHHFV